MGARAALRAADDPQVRGVVALAPWCPPGEPVAHLADRTILALQDEADRITSATGTWRYLARAHAAGARVLGIRMPGGHHPVAVHPEQPSLVRAMLGRKYGEPPSLLHAAEDFGLHPVLMRSLAPDVAADPAPRRTAPVISLGDRRRRGARLQVL